jgi:branched-chain amino acid transport system substrate-binding protein
MDVRRSRTRARVAAGFAVTALLLAACGSDDDKSAQSAPSTTATAAPTSSAGTASSAAPAATTTPESNESASTASSEPGSTGASASSAPEGSVSAQSGDPLKIGYIAPVGTTVLNFDFAVAAAQAAVIGINSRGGINGRPAELVFCNEKNDPNEAARCAQQMIDEGVIATAATLSLGGAAAIDTAMTEKGIPQINTFASSAPDYNPTGTAFMMNASTIGSALGLVKAAAEDGHKKIALVRLEGAFNQPTADAFKQFLPGYGVELVKDIQVPASTTDLAPVAQEVSDAGADFVVSVAATKEGPLLLALQQLGVDVEVGFTDGAFSTDQVKSLGDLLEGSYFAAPVPPLNADLPGVKQFLSDMDAARAAGVENAGEDLVRNNSMRVWDAVVAVADVANQSGATDSASLLKALKSGDTFTLAFDPPWTPSQAGPENWKGVSRPWVWTSVMHDGKLELRGDGPVNVFPTAG